MNIILLDPADWSDADHVTLKDHRHTHITRVLGATVGQQLRVGQINGSRGTGIITSLDKTGVSLRVTLSDAPTPRHPVTLILALPRPKMLRRVFRTVAEFGVSELHLIHSYRVDKSYWQTPFLNESAIDIALRAGLERACDTRLPVVQRHQRFKPFIEDRLREIAGRHPCYLCQPGNYPALPTALSSPATVVIGPEGGFIPFEVELAQQNGAQPAQLGQRILSVDTAVTSVLAMTAAVAG